MYPASASTAYSAGHPCPLERIKRSRSAHSASLGLWRSTRKYSAASNSTSESDPPGCPLPAAPIILMISIRRRLARRFNSVTDSILRAAVTSAVVLIGGNGLRPRLCARRHAPAAALWVSLSPRTRPVVSRWSCAALVCCDSRPRIPQSALPPAATARALDVVYSALRGAPNCRFQPPTAPAF